MAAVFQPDVFQHPLLFQTADAAPAVVAPAWAVTVTPPRRTQRRVGKVEGSIATAQAQSVRAVGMIGLRASLAVPTSQAVEAMAALTAVGALATEQAHRTRGFGSMRMRGTGRTHGQQAAEAVATQELRGQVATKEGDQEVPSYHAPDAPFWD